MKNRANDYIFVLFVQKTYPLYSISCCFEEILHVSKNRLTEFDVDRWKY